MPNDNFGAVGSGSQSGDRSSRARGILLSHESHGISSAIYTKICAPICAYVIPVSGSFMPPSGTHKPGVHLPGLSMPRIPISPFHGGPSSQPYAIPTRGGVHGPVGAVPQVPQPGTRGFGAGRGHAASPIGSHLPHQQGNQQSIGNVSSSFNFPALEGANSQPSMGGTLSQPGFVNNVLSTSYACIIPLKTC